MQKLWEDPPLNPLIGTLRITLDDTNEEEEVNDSKTIAPGDVVDEERTYPMPPQVGSPVATTTQ
jgi:hypothetical protein